MNRIIHKGFFREMCRQLRTKGLVATFILLGLNLIELSTFVIGDPIKYSLTHLHQSLMLAPTYIFLYVATPILAFGAYRWLNRRSQSDFYHAIPLTRLQMYGSTSAAVLFWLAIPITVHTLTRLLIYTVFGMPFNYLLQLCVYLNVLIAALAILGAISIGVSVSGSGFVAFFTAVVILFYPRAFLMLLAALIETRTQMSIPFSMQPFFINPSFNLAATPIHTLFYVPDLGNVLAMLYSLAYGLLLLTLGGVAFHRRKSEAAEIPYTNRTLQTLVRVAVGSLPLVCFAALLAAIFEEIDGYEQWSVLLPLAVTALVFSFVFYCLFELISSKRWKKVVKAMPFYPICLVLAAIILFVPAAAEKQSAGARISSANEVTGIRFVGNESSPLVPRALMLEKDYADVIGAKRTFTDRDVITQVVDSAYKLYGLGSSGTYNNVRLKGVNLVGISSVSRLEMIETCLKDESFREEYYAYPKGHIYYMCPGLTNAEAKEVGELFKKDYEALSEADRDKLLCSRKKINYYYMKTKPSASNLSITLYGCFGTENYEETFLIDELTPNAARRYLELLNAKNGEDVRKALDSLAYWMATGTDRIGQRYEGYIYLGNSDYSLSVWSLDSSMYRTSEAAHEKVYEILKALSEAPLSTDVSQCVTVRAEISTDGTKYRMACAGFQIPEEYREDLLAWITQGEPNDVFIDSYDFGSW